MEFTNILTERLRIQALELRDLADFHLYRSDPDIAKYQGFDVMSLAEAEEFILHNSKRQFGQAGEWKQFGIINQTNNKLIGDCALRLLKDDVRIAEIGISISQFEQKKGYAKETLQALISFLFKSGNIHRIVETVDAENTASIQLMRSLGFREEGHFIENIFFKGKWGSEIQFALLKREWLNLSKLK